MFSSLRGWLSRGNRGGVGKRGRRRDTQRWAQRQPFFERLEPRVILNAAPVARDDPWYYTAEDTGLTVTTSDTTLLDNDWDPEGDSLTASVVDSPAHGSLSNFSGSDGTFTYTPDTSYVGFDSFTDRKISSSWHRSSTRAQLHRQKDI
ncbi:MAG TPA: Ig-like domain-containing protein [Pirellulaceae bacterium]|nr:Ig-like domain-containing protein [Pirellulaceae bacterium]